MVPEAPFPCHSHPAPPARGGMEKAKGKEKVSNGPYFYGIWNYNCVVQSRHPSSGRSVIERLFLLKQKFSQSLPELLGIFSPSAALP